MKSSLKWAIAIIVLAAILGMAASFMIKPAAQILYKDTDGNTCREKYVLENQQLLVFENGEEIWHSPQEWHIKQIKLADADNNQQEEVLLVLWKKGSYGKSKPFWFTGTDNEYSCHLFVYKILAGKMKEVWCSSALEFPIINLEVKDTNGDGRNELNVTEGPRTGFAYALRQCFIQQESKWIWNGWGFERV